MRTELMKMGVDIYLVLILLFRIVDVVWVAEEEEAVVWIVLREGFGATIIDISLVLHPRKG